jgi:phage/plasmid-like protein (TIGR03299 family)
MQLTQPGHNAVTAAYAADGMGPMVYGRYKDRGYSVNPLIGRVGTMVPDNASAYEAFAIAGLGWTADKRECLFPGPDGPVQSPEHCSIVRSDTNQLLGIHGAGYTPVQNTALINLLDYLREDVTIENVLSIRDGKKVFATASIRVEDEVVPGDRVRRYLHAFNSFDGSSSFGVFFSDVRLRCANQLSYMTGKAVSRAQSEGSGLRMRHTQNVTSFAERLPQLIDLERRSFHQSISQLRELTQLKMTPEIAKRILEATYADKLALPTKDKDSGEKRDRTLNDLPEIGIIRSHYNGSTGLGILDTEGVRGTAYGLFNAITQFETHDAGRAKDEIERARTRLESLWGGGASKRIERAREACLALV